MTESGRYDVAVIGAGPGGSRAAERLARLGRRVLLLEKRERVGHPVRCAEAVGPREDVERYLALDDTLVSSPVDGVTVVAPDGARFERAFPGAGFVVDREAFDRRLSEAATAAGAELRTGHQAMGLLREDGRVAGVRVKDLRRGAEYDARAAVVVGADGVESLSPRWAGLKGHYRPEEIFSCAQHLVEGIDAGRAFIEFHLGRRFAPGGYAWVFPKGKDRANVGVGVNPLMADGKTAVQYLDAFLAHRCPGGARGRLVVGGCVVARGLPRLAADGYVAVGEAANQNNPFSGGGIVNALEGADMAAGAVARALERGRLSARDLSSYEKAWKRSTGRANEAFFHAARIFYALTDGELSRVVLELSRAKGVIGGKGVEPRRMIQALVVSNPRLLVQFLGYWLGAKRRR
ncbi:MAG: NAD(P)/FAD-dependent oxidoreductase [Candidatus Latescibacterota bacterium]|nr:MAG: NAD(P)/FAD-dependent oxidoreductase [Candidatus Latescibacterota bacterium]